MLQQFRGYLLAIANEELPEELKGKIGGSDLVQETFLEAQRDFAAFRGQNEELFRGWLRQILRNNLVNATRHYRDTGKRQAAREVRLGEAHQNLPQDQESPGARLLHQERDLDLQHALEQLPPQYRQAIQWRNYERLSFEEIGQRLQRSAEAARHLWIRALEKLKDLLHDSGSH